MMKLGTWGSSSGRRGEIGNVGERLVVKGKYQEASKGDLENQVAENMRKKLKEVERDK